MAGKAVEKHLDPDLGQESKEEVAWQDEDRCLVADIFARLGLNPGEIED
ncbi:MAG: hypothetical protein ABSC19_17105 [Syntrophorhabdales bacterium]